MSGVGLKVLLRLRLSTHDAHYGGGLVDGARVLGLFGDVATELLVRLDGDEGLFRAYESVEFLAPLHAGDFVEVEGEVLAVGKTSRKMRIRGRSRQRRGFRCLAAGVTHVPTARQTTTGRSSTSAAESDRSARGEITLRASKRILRLVFPTARTSPSTSTKSPACSGARNSTDS